MKEKEKNKIFLEKLVHIHNLNKKEIPFNKNLYPVNNSKLIKIYSSLKPYGLNLNKIGISNFSFYKCNFSNCSFNNSLISSNNFVNCDFTNVDFSNSKISFSNFENCNLENCNFYKCYVGNSFNGFIKKDNKYIVGNFNDSMSMVVLYTQFGISLKTWGK